MGVEPSPTGQAGAQNRRSQYTDLQAYLDTYQRAQTITIEPQVLYAHSVLAATQPAMSGIRSVDLFHRSTGSPGLDLRVLNYQAWIDETCSLVGAPLRGLSLRCNRAPV